MSDASAGRFLIELVSVFNGQGFDLADARITAAQQNAANAAQALRKSIASDGGLNARLGADAKARADISEAEIDREEFNISRRGRLYAEYFGARRLALLDWGRQEGGAERARLLSNRAALAQMERDWQRCANSCAGGLRQAMAIITERGADWTHNWLALVNSASASAAGSIKDFFDKSADAFMRLDTLVRGVFDSILNAFLDMVAQMAAKAAILTVFKGLGLFSGGVGETVFGSLFGSFAAGGYVPKTGPYLVHAGEYVLPPDVVDSIKLGAAPQPPRYYAAAASPAVNITHNPTINITGGINSELDARQVARQLSEAARRGVSWAVEQAKVGYKVGQKHSGDTAL